MFVVLYSSGHLLVITGYNWDYWDDTFYKWGFVLVKSHNCKLHGYYIYICIIKHSFWSYKPT